MSDCETPLERHRHDIILDFTAPSMKLFCHCETCAQTLADVHVPMFGALAAMPEAIEPHTCLLQGKLPPDQAGKIHKLTIVDLEDPMSLRSCCNNWLPEFVASPHFAAMKRMSAASEKVQLRSSHI